MIGAPKFEQEAHLSPSDPLDALYQLKCCSRVPLHTALNVVKRKNLIATWRWCRLDRNCDHQISTSIRDKCWWDRVFSRQRIVVNADHRGGWTQIFGCKASEPETSGPDVKRNFYLRTCISRPRWGWYNRNFIDNRWYLLHQKITESLGYPAALSAWSYV